MGVGSAMSTALGVAGGAVNYFEGRKRRKAAEAALAKFEYQDLENVHEGRQVSTLGADLKREENARLAATQTDALRNAGTRGLIGGLGRIQQNNNLLNREVSADLDRQQKDIDRDVANDNANIRQMTERRQSEELAGIGAELEAGRQTQANGVSGMIQSAQGGLLSLDNSMKSLVGMGGLGGNSSGGSSMFSSTNNTAQNLGYTPNTYQL